MLALSRSDFYMKKMYIFSPTPVKNDALYETTMGICYFLACK